MKTRSLAFPSLIALTFSSCATTVVKSPTTGKVLLATSADATSIDFHAGADGSVTLKGRHIDHSTPTAAQGAATAGKINATAAVLTAISLAP